MKICDNNVECAGFTFQGSFDTIQENEIFFFFAITDIEDDLDFLDWSTYVVQRLDRFCNI